MTVLQTPAAGPSGPASCAAPGDSPRWSLHPYFVLRVAGFPFTWVADLASPAATEAAHRSLESIAAVAALRAEAAGPEWTSETTTGDDAKLLAALRAGRRAPARQRATSSERLRAAAIALDAALTQAESDGKHFEATYRAENSRIGSEVVTRFQGEPGLRDMLLVSNESSYPNLCAWLDAVAEGDPDARNADRKQLDTLVRYAQRVCAKNDTTSHFGPFNTGRWVGSEADAVDVRDGLRRYPVLSRWAAALLAEAMAVDADVLPRLRPRRTPGAFLEGSVLTVVDLWGGGSSGATHSVEAPIELSADEAKVLELCSGDVTVADLAGALGACRPGPEVTVADIGAVLRRLEGLSAVIIGPEVPYGEEDPLGFLHALAEAWGATGWTAVFEKWIALIRQYALSDTRGRAEALRACSELLPEPDRRDTPRTQFYSDRSIINEQCIGWSSRLRIGSWLRSQIEASLTRVCELFLLAPTHRLYAERKVIGEWFDDRFGTEREVPALAYVTAFLDAGSGLCTRLGKVRAAVAGLEAELDACLLPRPVDAQARYDIAPEVLDDVLGRHRLDVPAVCNPDIMLLAPADPGVDPLFVIGEVHATEENLSHGSFGPFVARDHQDFTEATAQAYSTLLGPDEELVDVTQRHRNRTWVRASLGCPDVEFGDRSDRPLSEVIPWRELTVRCDRAGGSNAPRLRLHAPGRSHALRLTVAPMQWRRATLDPFAIFAFPFTLGHLPVPGTGRDHLPRLTCGSVVLQRECWRRPASDLQAGRRDEGYLRFQRRRAELGLPRWIFAKLPGQPKPVFVDGDNPLLIRQLTKMANAEDPAAVVQFSEMLPGGDRLWYSTPDGPHTSELRCSAFRPAGVVA